MKTSAERLTGLFVELLQLLFLLCLGGRADQGLEVGGQGQLQQAQYATAVGGRGVARDMADHLRRYVDLVNQRQIVAAARGLERRQLLRLCRHCSKRFAKGHMHPAFKTYYTFNNTVDIFKLAFLVTAGGLFLP